ncbi:HDOD domain-containing protein, partial [Thermodesulfobacteriota bacterium]
MKVEEEYIKHIDKLMPCPDIALAILKIAHEDDCNVSTLARNIEKDPTLTANMLKMANSAYFGHMKQIHSITDIIVRLGMETVKLIAITSASAGLLNSNQKAYNLKNGALWRHSYATALLASIICRYAGVDDESSIYTAALLHDIGKVVLNKHLQREILNANEPEAGTTMIAYERAVLHTDHARVGEALLNKWGLPGSITKAVGDHHRLTNA